MNKREAERLNSQESMLLTLGFTMTEAETLRRISMTLNRWYEKECGSEWGSLERDETTGIPYMVNATTGRRFKTPDRERGAEKRLCAIMDARNGRSIEPLTSYLQTDPRGAALYLLRPGDVPEGEDPSNLYSRGICIY